MIKYILTLVWALTITSAYAQTSDIMKKNILTQRQLSLAECASLEAQGDMVRLDAALSKALDNGVSVNELKFLPSSRPDLRGHDREGSEEASREGVKNPRLEEGPG